MPPVWIRLLSAVLLGTTSVTLANQRTISTPLYDAHVHVEGIHNTVFNVDLIPGSPLVGMRFMKRVAPLLTFQFPERRVRLWR